jgi:Pseudomonas avirulence D protein (AvrD)
VNMTATHLTYASMEDYLGPGDSRFFSAGYRRSDHEVTGLITTPADVAEPGAQATVTVQYPHDWSKKTEDTDLPPHLSSVDILLLGAQLAEAHLTHAYGLDGAMRGRMWLRKVTLRASTTPQEDLTGMPAWAKLRETSPVADVSGRFVSVYDCAVGVMRTRCEIEHEIGQRSSAERSDSTLEALLGPAAARYYGEGFKLRSQSIQDVSVDLGSLHSDAQVRIASIGEAHTAAEGIEGSYQPSASMIDCFVVTLQMAQVLMYELDGVSRRDSNTLWMLQTVLEADRPDRPFAGPHAAHTTIAGKHLLKLRGGTWRNVDITGGFAGITLRASLAHELPKAAVAGAAA